MNYFFALAVALFFSGTIAAQQGPSFQCDFNHLALPVKDLKVSVDFYRRVLHLTEITNRTQNPDIRWLSLGGDKELHLIAGAYEPVRVNKAVHVALRTANIEVLVNHLKSLDIPYSDWAGNPNTVSVRADGVKQIYFQDPDGYWIEVNNGYGGPLGDMEVKDAIWQLEEDYWVFVKNKNYAQYRELWDDKFKGYPTTNIIGGKANITDWMTQMYAKNEGKMFEYTLKRMEENVFGDIVVVLYDATTFWKNSMGEVLDKVTYKLTHTWMKTPAGWRIIGGMGAVK